MKADKQAEATRQAAAEASRQATAAAATLAAVASATAAPDGATSHATVTVERPAAAAAPPAAAIAKPAAAPPPAAAIAKQRGKRTRGKQSPDDSVIRRCLYDNTSKADFEHMKSKAVHKSRFELPQRTFLMPNSKTPDERVWNLRVGWKKNDRVSQLHKGARVSALIPTLTLWTLALHVVCCPTPRLFVLLWRIVS